MAHTRPSTDSDIHASADAVGMHIATPEGALPTWPAVHAGIRTTRTGAGRRAIGRCDTLRWGRPPATPRARGTLIRATQAIASDVFCHHYPSAWTIALPSGPRP